MFVSNGTKPSRKERASRAPVTITNFSRPCLEVAQQIGYRVMLGVNRDNPDNLLSEPGIAFYDSSTYRNPLNLWDIVRAIRNLLRLLRSEDCDVIHCNTPIGGVVGRICGAIAGTRKVIYTAHGFHFYEGGNPVKNIVYRTVESVLARQTDALITINEEDFRAASKFRLRGNGQVHKVPGVGIDVETFANVDETKSEIRSSLGIMDDAFVYTSVGDLLPGKGFRKIIESVAYAQDPNMHIVICGTGPDHDTLLELASDHAVQSQVHLLGKRGDVSRILKAADGFVFASRREGLPRAVMEAMAAGLPCIVSRVRGNVDLIEDGVGGFVVEVDDTEGFAGRMKELRDVPDARLAMGLRNSKESERFRTDSVKSLIREIYEEVI